LSPETRIRCLLNGTISLLTRRSIELPQTRAQNVSGRRRRWPARGRIHPDSAMPARSRTGDFASPSLMQRRGLRATGPQVYPLSLVCSWSIATGVIAMAWPRFRSSSPSACRRLRRFARSCPGARLRRPGPVRLVAGYQGELPLFLDPVWHEPVGTV
jgi:hypothetical protein